MWCGKGWWTYIVLRGVEATEVVTVLVDAASVEVTVLKAVGDGMPKHSQTCKITLGGSSLKTPGVGDGTEYPRASSWLAVPLCPAQVRVEVEAVIVARTVDVEV